MLTDYIAAAMRQAEYKVLEDDTYWGETPPLRGVWANADSLKECEKELESVLEDWILISLNFGDAIPEIDGVRVRAKAKGLV
ncbi:MAG: type II toxin-antitoxin system HicB family antitoxin [Chloroflexi bacterium]|nr:type II toxin-antitoxin system HicB family antitoxin [Chloroflexota bacterium]